jgi:predicted RNA-binding Zn-ribbon protein involved in translation (DUF1610 family)
VVPVDAVREEAMMSVTWTYESNPDREEFYCPHCGDLRDSAYFSSGENFICLRCARVLVKCYRLYGSEEGW